MPLILKLGYTNILLPDDAPVATILKCFQRAVEVDDHTYDPHDPRLVIDGTGQVRVEIKNVPAGTRIVHEEDGQEVEVPPPNANGKPPGTGLAVPRRRRAAKRTPYLVDCMPLLEREP